MLPAKKDKARGLPVKLGAQVTTEKSGAARIASPRDEVKKEVEQQRDSMDLSSLGNFLTKGGEAVLTNEEQGGIIPGIIEGLEKADDDDPEDLEEVIFGGGGDAKQLTAVDQFDALSDSVETLLVSLVLCRRRTRFLCVQELDNTWYIPGGTVDAGESFEGAAMRSAMEEANVQIEIDGILRVEYSTSNGVRIRVIFKANPVDPTVLPKQDADKHSLQAKWLSAVALKKFRLRTETILDMFEWTEADAPAYPLDMFDFPPFGPERSQIDHNQSVTLLVHRAHLVVVDRKRRVFCLPDKSLPTMTLKEGQSFLRFPAIMSQKYLMVMGMEAASAVEVLHIWHAPPNPLDSVGTFLVTYVQRVRGDFTATMDCVTSATVDNLRCVPAVKKRIKKLLDPDAQVATMPLSKFVHEGTPYKE